MDLISFSVPGNLLLMGEYTILEEKGLGLAIAINKRAFFSFKKSDSWRFFSKKKKIDDFSLIENRSDFVFKMFAYLSQNCTHEYYKIKIQSTSDNMQDSHCDTQQSKFNQPEI